MKPVCNLRTKPLNHIQQAADFLQGPVRFNVWQAVSPTGKKKKLFSLALSFLMHLLINSVGPKLEVQLLNTKYRTLSSVLGKPVLWV